MSTQHCGCPSPGPQEDLLPHASLLPRLHLSGSGSHTVNTGTQPAGLQTRLALPFPPGTRTVDSDRAGAVTGHHSAVLLRETQGGSKETPWGQHALPQAMLAEVCGSGAELARPLEEEVRVRGTMSLTVFPSFHPLRHQATTSWMPSGCGLIPDSQHLPHGYLLFLCACCSHEQEPSPHCSWRTPCRGFGYD